MRIEKFDLALLQREAKFLLILRADGEIIGTIFPRYINHRDRLIEWETKGSTLLGGGLVGFHGTELTADWASPGCIEERGYDRPENPKEAARILEEFLRKASEAIRI